VVLIGKADRNSQIGKVGIIDRLFEELLRMYGPQGWWPLLTCKGCNPTKTGSSQGYHPGDYSYPQTDNQRFEICVGAILTQNTSWPNVEKALFNLAREGLLEPMIMVADEGKISQAIKPAGYFNQKTRKLKVFSSFWVNLKGNPKREDLLSLWGIGPETADSILLYAFRMPEFVVDTYTRRILLNLCLIEDEDSYDDVKRLLISGARNDFRTYQEYHALFVEHAKRYYQKKPYGKDCPLKKLLSAPEI